MGDPMAERNTFWVMARAKQWIVRHDDVDLATLPSRTRTRWRWRSNRAKAKTSPARSLVLGPKRRHRGAPQRSGEGSPWLRSRETRWRPWPRWGCVPDTVVPPGREQLRTSSVPPSAARRSAMFCSPMPYGRGCAASNPRVRRRRPRGRGRRRSRRRSHRRRSGRAAYFARRSGAPRAPRR